MSGPDAESAGNLVRAFLLGALLSMALAFSVATPALLEAYR